MAARRFHRLRTVFHKKAMILVYHRVAEANVDPWALGVSPAHFAQHLEVLKTIANPISLQELINAKSDRELPPRPVCITFDDGYADNLYAAKPALESYRVPGTVFVTPGYIGVPENLWWDELAKLLLDPASRQEELSLSLNGYHYAYAFPPEEGRRAGQIRITSGEPGKAHPGPARKPSWRSMACSSNFQTASAKRRSNSSAEERHRTRTTGNIAVSPRMSYGNWLRASWWRSARTP